MPQDIWYIEKDPEQPLDQGDIITDCPYLIHTQPPLAHKDGISYGFKWVTLDAVVLTQTCDLTGKSDRANQILLCPAPELPIFKSNWEAGLAEKDRADGGRWRNLLGAIRSAKINTLMLLQSHRSDKLNSDFRVVSFQQNFSLPLESVDARVKAGDRLALKSPYREALNNRFGGWLTRIGLPVYTGLT